MVSRKKTVVISNDNMEKWPYLLIDGPHEGLLVVLKAKFLGVMVLASKEMMRMSFMQRLRAICSSYVKTILMYTGTKYSHVQSSLAIWNGVAVPSLLYGSKVLNVVVDTKHYLDLQQRKLGKLLLRVPMSSANECVETELGLRPISEMIEERKLKFASKLQDENVGARITKEVYKYVNDLG